MRISNLSFIALGLALSGWAMAGGAEPWVVGQSTAPARYTHDNKTWTEIVPGMEVPPGVWVLTGPNGRVMLHRGTETILFRANTLASITSLAGGLGTKIAQRRGLLALDVHPGTRARLTVETPMITAVVKGTRFEIAAGPHSSHIEVARGLVETRDRRGRFLAMLHGGQSQTVRDTILAPQAPPRVSGAVFAR